MAKGETKICNKNISKNVAVQIYKYATKIYQKMWPCKYINCLVVKDYKLNKGIYAPPIHWVGLGTGTPKDRDKVV
jgi:hypothetical protein